MTEDSGGSQAGAGRPLQGAEWGPFVCPEVERPCVCEACLGEAGAGLEGWGLVTEALSVSWMPLLVLGISVPLLKARRAGLICAHLIEAEDQRGKDICLRLYSS